MNLELERKLRVSFPMGILDVAIDEDSQSAYFACMDGLYLYDLSPPSEGGGANNGESKKAVPIKIGEHSSYVSGVACSPKLGQLFSASYDGTYQTRLLPHSTSDAGKLVGAKETEPLVNKKIHGFWSWQMAMSPNEELVASVTGQYLAGSEDYQPLASEEATVKVVVAATGETVFEGQMLPSVQCVAIDPSSTYVAAGNLIGDLAVWEIASGQQIASWKTSSFSSWGVIKSHCYIGGIYAVSFSPDGKYLYAAGMGEMVDPMAGNGKQRWQKFEWQKQPVEKVAESKDDQTGEGLMETLAWHPSGKYFAMAGRLRGGNWNVAIFSAETGEIIGQGKTGMRITSAQFSKDGNSLFLAGMQGQPEPKDGKFGDFGYFEKYQINDKSIG